VRAESIFASPPQAGTAATPQQLMLLLVNSMCPFHRECAANELSKLDWHANPDVVQTLLIAAQRDSTPAVRAASIRALAYMKCDTVAVDIALQACKKDSDPRVEHAARVALEQFQAIHAGSPESAANRATEELAFQEMQMQANCNGIHLDPAFAAPQATRTASTPNTATPVAMGHAAENNSGLFKAAENNSGLFRSCQPIEPAAVVLHPVPSTPVPSTATATPRKPTNGIRLVNCAPLAATRDTVQKVANVPGATSQPPAGAQPIQYFAVPAAPNAPTK
jgi:hypothetical protein